MIESVFAGLFGLLIGSFLNVVIYRLPRDLSIVAPRSFCPSCTRQIAWFDNIPVITYMVLGGHCRRCHARIPLRYPVVELLTGALFFGAVYWFGPTVVAAKVCVFSAMQIALIFTDLEERILPDEITLGGVIVGLLFAPFARIPLGLTGLFLAPDADPRWASLIESAVGAAVTAGLLWALGTAYRLVRRREGLGLGDVKMIAMIGAFLGLLGSLQTVMIGALGGSVIGLLYIWLARKDRTYELPFGSFLGAAAIVVIFLEYWRGAALAQ